MDVNTVLDYFKDFSKINRCSKNEDKIADYLENFAKSNNLEYERDKYNNIYIKKKAADEFKDSPGIILQAHMDMVCVSDYDYDFENGVEILQRDGFLVAKNTTLGADNGIGLAIAMASLTSDAKTCQIEAVITTSEEVDMGGAMNCEFDLQGKYFINLDSENEDELIVGSSGGENINVEIEKNYTQDSKSKFYEISVHGLKGGHSGMEIDKNHQNAIKILFDYFDMLDDFYICDCTAGTKDNAIPTNAKAIISSDELLEDLNLKAEKYISNIKLEEFDKDLNFEIKECDPQKCMDQNSSQKLKSIIKNTHTGVVSYVKGLDDVVQTSNNLAIIESNDEKLTIISSYRSSDMDELKKLRDDIKSKALEQNCKAYEYNFYPAWEFNENSKLMEIAKKVYREKYNREIEVKVIHAGLECGIFSEKYKNLDCISIGPNIYDVHTTKERLDIKSTERFVEFYKSIIKQLTD